jgi:hypothetical protein
LTFNSEKYILNIYDNGFSGSQLTNGAMGVVKRIIDITNSAETKSIYYVRKHKIITEVNDAILTNAGFDQNGFGVKRQYEYSSLTPYNKSNITLKEGNQSYLLSFHKDIDISQYRDNLNRPISKLFFTIVNKGYFGWMNPPLDNAIPNCPAIRTGYGYNLTSSTSPYWDLQDPINYSNINTNSYTRPPFPFTFYYNIDLYSGFTMDGDFCEFNVSEQKERVISESYHKIQFNSVLFDVDVNATTNPIGYYYQPHHPITLRVYSDYIEEAPLSGINGVPDYAYYSNYFNNLKWRDLYTYGFIDENGLGVDYPFLNGAHYPSTNIIFRLFPEGNITQNLQTVADPITDDCE